MYFVWAFFVLIFVYLATMVAIVQYKKDTSIANFTWGGGCLLIAWYLFIMAILFNPYREWMSARVFILLTLITLWAGRLILYVYLRYTGKDPRYQTWKRSGIKALLINIGYIFVLQGIMMFIMSMPTVAILSPLRLDTLPLTYLDYIGILIWCIGFYFEAVSDAQLFTFTRNPANKGKVMRYGLWRYSRHPNYFGEILMWWGIFLIALNVPYGILAIIAPLTITFLLIFVTGIPWVEKAMDANPEYQEYKEHTSMLIPWFSKE
jgi:steroid 5-alpha reductase family enzyme